MSFVTSPVNLTTLNNISSTVSNFCNASDDFPRYPSILGLTLAVPQWEAIGTVLILGFIIIFTIVGNILVILSVFTYRPLKVVQNFFIVSLAVADLTVAILVLPLNIAYSILGVWDFGIATCKMWLTADVLCCTASILHLCVIALDRFWAISRPLEYRRTLERVLAMIALVWILSLVISSPPLLGWNDWPERFTKDTPCQLTSRVDYVIYSALGSFYLPLVLMGFVYFQIYLATRRRLRQRAKASKMNVINPSKLKSSENQVDQDSISSETNHNEQITVLDKSLHNQSNRSGIENEIQLSPIGINKTTTNKPSRSRQLQNFVQDRQKISLSKERRAARVLLLLMSIFVICWLPFFIMYVILPFCSSGSCCPSKKLINFITWLGYLNSSLNPIIYTVFNLDFRRAFKKLLGI